MAVSSRGSSAQSAYRQDLLGRFAAYRARSAAGQDGLFDPDPRRPHVFARRSQDLNLFQPELGSLLPGRRRHMWFGSMGSSQALAVSVFGTMLRRDGPGLFAALRDVAGRPLLPGFVPEAAPEFDYAVRTLGEPRPTQIDLFLPGSGGNVAIECKLMEAEIGRCSHVPLECDGDYAAPNAGDERCFLIGRGVRYWQHIPNLFEWDPAADLQPCPLRDGYQLARNVLAAAVDESGQVHGEPVAVLVHDARNPTFWPGGAGDGQYRAVAAALRGPARLGRSTWQRVAGVLAERGSYADLLDWLADKYGIEPEGEGA